MGRMGRFHRFRGPLTGAEGHVVRNNRVEPWIPGATLLADLYK